MSKIITVPFTEPFIERLADYIDAEYIHPGKDLKRLAVVFGGRRPSLFLRRALAKRVKGAFYPPAAFSMDEFIATITESQERKSLLDLDHCFLIYQLTEQYAPQLLKGRDEFVQFLPWAREILNFIEHLDLEFTPADALNVLREHAAIGFNVPDDINLLLEALVVLRKQYHQYLDQHQLTSRGYRYLSAARLVNDCAFEQFDQILFCNFFYLHRTEMTVFKNLFDRGKATLLMQGDERKWPALKRIGRTFEQPIVEGEHVTPTTFALKLYAAFDMHAQAALAGEVLKTIPDLANAVIVLPNADAMLPLLSAIGPQLDEFNISMGYPLKRSSLYALLESIVQAHKTMHGQMYYSRDYLRVLRHPLVKNLDFGMGQGAMSVIVHKLEEILTGAITSDISGQIFITVDHIVRDEVFLSEVIIALQAMDITATPVQIKTIMSDVHPFNERVASRMLEIADEWATAQFAKHPFDREGLLRMMQERLGRELVAFSGSPLRGLQILGLQETRSLSFDHVIVLDVNERILPDLNIYEPLIPREVMIKMNLDRLELEEEIQRYQFMRLISSAKHVHLIYQDRTDKERSRFIEELIWEQEQRAGVIDVVDIVRPAFTVGIKESLRAVPKTKEVVEFLKTFTYSATSVNTYLRNPYEFYQNYVLGLREKEDLLDDPQSRHIGTFIHGLLEDAFKPWIGKKPVIDVQFQKHFKDMFESRFHQFFGRGMRSDAFLIKTVVENRLNRFLDVEAKRLDAEVSELLFIERKFDDVIQLPTAPVRFSFRVDRVDRLNDGTILILDYKTGGADAMPSLSGPIVSFQMPLYLYYLDKQYPAQPVNAAIYHLRTMAMEEFITAKTKMPRAQMIEEYLKALDFVMAEIFNLEKPFTEEPVVIELSYV